MTAPRTTALVIVAGTLSWVLYDLVAYAATGDPGTLSRVMLRMGEGPTAFAAAVVFLLGVLTGHLFLPQRPRHNGPGH